MKQETRYLISDAAKKVTVETHVLRYWEEELKLPIKRNELGHRYYTEDDIARFKEIKALKEQGLQLKAIRIILKDGKLESFTGKEISARMEMPEKESKHVIVMNSSEIMTAQSNPAQAPAAQGESKEAKSLRLQQVLQHMITEAVRTNNQELCQDIKESMVKEMDYQFRLQEEREEIRVKDQIGRDERHYQRIDELISKKRGKVKRGTEDKAGLFKKKNERKGSSI